VFLSELAANGPSNEDHSWTLQQRQFRQTLKVISP